MGQSQVKIRLDDRLIAQLKQQSSELQISVSALCNRLLENEVLGVDSKLVGMTRVCVRIDRLMCTLRSIEKKSLYRRKKPNDPNQN